MAELFFFFVEKRKKEMGRGRGCETAVSFFHHLPEHRPQIASPSEHSSYLPAEVAAVRVPVGVPAEFVVHLHGGGGVFVSRFLFYAVDVVDVFDRRKRFERERARGERKKRFDAKNYSRSLHEKINQQFFSSPLLLKPKMASHLASLGKVGPTIGERVSSWKKRAGVDQQKEDRNVRLFGRRRCPPTIAPSKKKTRPRFLSFSPPAPPLSHAARLFPSPPPPTPLDLPPKNSPSQKFTAAFFGLAGLCVFAQPRLFNHRSRESIPSFAADWKLQEEVRLRSMEREGAPGTTVVCDPVRRGA